jgi:predicted nucleic acid-binding protein
VRNSEQFAITSLTEYEIGNVLWKEDKKKRLKDAKRIAAIFSQAISELTKISLDSVADVLTIATNRDLSFYDASYAYVAEKNGLILLTEDRHLLKRCKCAISTKDVTDL